MSDKLGELRSVRIKKAEALRKLGQEPYPARVQRSTTIGPLIDNFEEHKGQTHTIVDRVKAHRNHGKLAFADIQDTTGTIQLFIKENRVQGPLSFEQIEDLLDVGDFVEATGEVFKTRREEISLKLTSLRIITKSIRPLPEKWSGLKDTDVLVCGFDYTEQGAQALEKGDLLCDIDTKPRYLGELAVQLIKQELDEQPVAEKTMYTTELRTR